MLWRFTLPLLLSNAFLPLVWSLRIDWDYDEVRSWDFVTRFAFLMESQRSIQEIHSTVASGSYIDPSDEYADHFIELRKLEKGRMNYEFKWLPYQKPKLLVFLDFDDWQDVLDDPRHSCYDVVNMADLVIELREHFVYGQSAAYDETASIGYQNIVDARTNTSSTGIVFFPEGGASVRARWGIFLLANCEASETCHASSTCQGPLVVDTDLHLLNDINSSGLKEFSFEDRNLAWLTWLFWILQCALVLISWHCRRQLKAISKYHPTVKVFYYSCWLQFFSLVVQFQFWTYYGSYGEPIYESLLIAHFLTDIANFMLLVNLVLVAKGWTIVRRHLSPQGVVKVIVYSSAYFIFLVFAQLYAYYAYDETRSTVYFYISPPGIILLLMRCVLGAVWFNYACLTTRRNFKKKVKFYRKFQTFFTVWIVAPAFFVLGTVGMSQFDWTVYTFVWENLLTMCAQYSLCVLYDPTVSTVNEGFPFHQLTPEGISRSLWETDVLDNTTIDSMMQQLSDSTAKDGTQQTDLVGGSRFKNRAAARVTHVFTNQQGQAKQHITLADVYSDIKAQAGAIVYIVRNLIPKVDMFTEVLEDWDVEVDIDSDSAKED